MIMMILFLVFPMLVGLQEGFCCSWGCLLIWNLSLTKLLSKRRWWWCWEETPNLIGSLFFSVSNDKLMFSLVSWFPLWISSCIFCFSSLKQNFIFSIASITKSSQVSRVVKHKRTWSRRNRDTWKKLQQRKTTRSGNRMSWFLSILPFFPWNINTDAWRSRYISLDHGCKVFQD
jgi:hypothetical protein